MTKIIEFYNSWVELENGKLGYKLYTLQMNDDGSDTATIRDGNIPENASVLTIDRGHYEFWKGSATGAGIKHINPNMHINENPVFNNSGTTDTGATGNSNNTANSGRSNIVNESSHQTIPDNSNTGSSTVSDESNDPREAVEPKDTSNTSSDNPTNI